MTLFGHSLSFDEVKDYLAQYSSIGKKIISARIDYHENPGNYDLLILFEEKEKFSQAEGDQKSLKASAKRTAP